MMLRSFLLVIALVTAGSVRVDDSSATPTDSVGSATNKLTGRWSSSDPKIRLGAVEDLRDHGVSKPEIIIAVVPALVEAMKSDTHVGVRKAAVKALGRLWNVEGVDALVKTHLIAELVEALQHGARIPPSLPSWEFASDDERPDPDAAVRARVAKLFGEMGVNDDGFASTTVVSSLMTSLQEDWDVAVREEAIKALPKLSSSAATIWPTLLQALANDRDFNVRILAIEAIAQIASAVPGFQNAALAALDKAVEEDDDRLVKRVAREDAAKMRRAA